MITIAIANRKGGVGKTTTAVNVACQLARYGKRVALLDLDTQRNASIHSGVRIDPPLPSPAYRAIVDGESLRGVAQPTAFGFDLVAAGRDLDKAADAIRDPDTVDGLKLLREAVVEAAHDKQWDVLIIDCPPSVGDVSASALVAADWVLIPMPMQKFPYEGLVEVLDQIEAVTRTDNHGLRVAGVFETLIDNNTTSYSVVKGQVEELCGELVLGTRVRRNNALHEACMKGVPVLFHRPDCHGAEDYRALCDELAARGVL